MVVLVRALIGIAFFGAGSYVGYYAVHPVNTTALIVAAVLFSLGGLVSDYDDMAQAISKVISLRSSLPSISNRDNS